MKSPYYNKLAFKVVSEQIPLQEVKERYFKRSISQYYEWYNLYYLPVATMKQKKDQTLKMISVGIVSNQLVNLMRGTINDLLNIWRQVKDDYDEDDAYNNYNMVAAVEKAAVEEDIAINNANNMFKKYYPSLLIKFETLVDYGYMDRADVNALSTELKDAIVTLEENRAASASVALILYGAL